MLDLGLVLGIVSAVGIPFTLGLTMSPTTRGEFRFARGCLIASAAMSILSLFVVQWLDNWGPLEMKIIINALIAAIIVAALTYGLDWSQKKQASLESRPATAASVDPFIAGQFSEISRLEEFIGGKDEMELREIFDFPNLFSINMQMTKARLEKTEKTKTNVFDMTSYLKNGERMQFDGAIAGPNLKRTPNGFSYDPDPNKLALIILTKKYLESKKTMIAFSGSAKLPRDVIEKVNEFNAAIQSNTSSLQIVLNQVLQESPEYFLHFDDPTSKYGGVADNRVLDQFIQLKPKADAIIQSLRTHLKVNDARR